jgi:outer membrane protein OmpA-like peptidoglycan-associated protein
VTFLKEFPDREVVVEGYTDSTGSGVYNLELSQQRANSVQSFLVGNGISPDRIVARGYGEAYPVAPNDTAAGRQKNRRVEIIILHAGEQAETYKHPA